MRPLPTKYEDAEAVAQFYDRLIERLEAVPGVMRAGAINALPLAGGGPNLTTVIEEFPPAEGEFPPVFQIRRAAPGYFETMRIPLVEGRAFTSDDHNRRLGSVVISRSVKDRYCECATRRPRGGHGTRGDVARQLTAGLERYDSLPRQATAAIGRASMCQSPSSPSAKPASCRSALRLSSAL